MAAMQPVIAQHVPLDPAVRTGKLANGFTYYIRHNEQPRNRALFYLVNKAGSVLEDADQRGLAHFLEHMNFNGTRHFPRNELVSHLQKAGVRFGADLNAYTTFDETVYQLPMPSDDPAMLTLALEIMRDWAQEATLDPQEIEKERGIVLEEERLGKGAKERMSRRYLPMLLNNSRYANRLPIGTDSVLLHFQRPVIKRFHSDWYRPNLQALIVVGDIDAAAMEKMVRAQFGTLKNPVHERARPAYTIPLTGKNQFMVVTDPETATTELDIYIKHKAAAIRTEADYLALVKRTLFNQLLNTRRYNETSREHNPAMVSAGMSISPLPGGLDAFSFTVTAKEGQLPAAFKQAWSVVEKVRRYGFTQTELNRARQQYLRNLEQLLNEQDRTPSVDFVKEYQRLFLQQEAAPGIQWEYNFAKAKLPAITLQDINNVTTAYIQDINRDILILAPDDKKQSLPAEDTVTAWLNEMQGMRLDPYVEDTLVHSILTVLPQRGRVTAADSLPAIGVTMLTLSNGVKVVLKPTTFKNDEIRFKGFAPGGASLYNDSDYDAAASAAAIIGSFGLGSLSPVQVNSALNGKVVQVAPFIDKRTAGVHGACATQDLETALQLVYMQFTHPRKDTMLYNNIINRSRAVLPNRYAEPNNIFNDTMAYVMGGYSYRSSPPTLAKLDRIGLDKVYDIYRERFADATGFTFVFVGNFNTAAIQPLLEQYLGALPAAGHKDTAIDRGIHIPPGRIVKTVKAGKADKALVRLIVSGDYSYSPANNQVLNALAQVLQIRLLQNLREAEGEVYSPTVQFTFNKQPRERYAFIIAFGCAPANADHLVNLVRREMEALRTTPVETDNIMKVKAAVIRNTELALKDNGWWLSYLDGQLENGEDLLQVQDVQKNLDALTPAAMQQAASLYLTEKNLLQFMLLPGGR